MKAKRNVIQTPQYLSGWKDIAKYLGKGVRTVQRYERFMGLPVRRPAAKPRGSVVATRAEIDAWVQAIPLRETLQLQARAKAPAHFTATMTDGIAEMTRLRDQMIQLRMEVRRSVRALHETIQSVYGEMNNQWRRTLLSGVESRIHDSLHATDPATRPGRSN